MPFSALGGYDETIYMGEDVDFYWRMGRTARLSGRQTSLHHRPAGNRLATSIRQWPTWKILLWTNPSSSPHSTPQECMDGLVQRRPKMIFSGRMASDESSKIVE